MTSRPPNDPKNRGEWQTAVDAAKFFLLVESARMYGLLEGGPGVNTARCEEILRRGSEIGITPKPVDKLVLEFITK